MVSIKQFDKRKGLDQDIEEIRKKEPAEILLKGVGVVGNQIFIQGIPLNKNWEDLRTSLDNQIGRAHV